MHINPIDPKYNVALMASAGTGKTYNLALRVVVTLMRSKSFAVPIYDVHGEKVTAEDVKYSTGRVMCLTFTRKAAAEMGTRVYEYLSKLANGQFDESSHEYLVVAEVLGISSPEEMRRRALNARQNIFRDPRQLYISTIDGFMALILKLFPFEANVRPDFSIISDAQIIKTSKDAFQHAFKRLPHKTKYNQLFRRYIQWTQSQPYLFTRELKNTVEWILERSIWLEDELNTASGRDVDDLLALMEKAEENDALILEHTGNLTACLCEPDNEGKRSAKLENQLDNFIRLSQGEKSVAEMFDKMDRLHPETAYKAKFKAPDHYQTIYAELEECLKKYAAFYERLNIDIAMHMSFWVQACVNRIKEEKGQLTYSDITHTVYDLLNRRTYPVNSEHLYFRLDGRLEHILLDEFQDTSNVQWAVLAPLTEEAMSGLSQSEKVGSFFCVGDSKQAIYRFRGATPGFMQNLVNSYKGRLHYEELSVNYRSDRNIVEFANTLFADADETIGGKDALRFSFVPQTAKSDADGYVQLSVIDAPTAEERMRERLFLLHTAVNDLLAHHFRPGDIAVIVTQKADGVIAHRSLQAAGIPSSLHFSEYLNARASYKIINALVRYIYRRDEFSLTEFLLSPPKICHPDKLGSKSFLKRYRYILDNHLKKSEGKSIYARLFAINGKLSLRDRLSGEGDFVMLMDIMANRISTEKNPLKFLEILDDMAGQTRVGGTSGGKISVITAHGAKGLEFPATILFKVKESFAMHVSTSHFADETPGGAPKVYKKLKNAFRAFAPQQYQEALIRENAFIRYERINQLYVAVTRACKALYVFADTYSNIPNTDGYMIRHFPEGYTAGMLTPCSSLPAEKENGSGADSFTKLAWHAIYPAIQTSGDPEKVASLFCTAAEKIPAALPVKNRAEQYVKKQAAQRNISEEEDAGAEPYSSRYYGLFVHEALYRIQHYTISAIGMAIAKAWGLYGGYLDESARLRGTQDLQTLISDEGWQQIIKDAEIFREKVITAYGEVMVVDMFAKTDSEIRIIDYKTASPDSVRNEEYLRQMEKYKKALRLYYHLPVKGYLVYLHSSRAEIRLI